ncbi:hypothetical protein S83_066561, partial [Arachis hypogaea]
TLTCILLIQFSNDQLQIAIYFAFLGMYTQWLLFPAVVGLIVYFIDYGSAPCFLHCGHTMGYYVFSVLETEKCCTFLCGLV